MPPQISISKLAQYLKGKTARKILQEFPKLNKSFWGKHFWSRGYFVATSGAITDEMIAQMMDGQPLRCTKVYMKLTNAQFNKLVKTLQAAVKTK